MEKTMSKEEKRNALRIAHFIMEDYNDRKKWEEIKYPTSVSINKEYVDNNLVGDELINWALEVEQQKFTVKYDEKFTVKYDKCNQSYWFKIYHTEL